MAKFATHMGDPHGDLQTSPQHADPHGFLVQFSLKRPQVHVDRRIVGWSAGRHVDHPCGVANLACSKNHWCCILKGGWSFSKEHLVVCVVLVVASVKQ